MVRGPFAFLAVVLTVGVGTVVLMPVAVLLGYPGLVLAGVWAAREWAAGRLDRPAGTAAVWATYLGLVLAVHGLVLGADTALAGAPPSDEQRRAGARLAWTGGALAGAAAVAAYAAGRRGSGASGRPSGQAGADPTDGTSPAEPSARDDRRGTERFGS